MPYAPGIQNNAGSLFTQGVQSGNAIGADFGRQLDKWREDKKREYTNGKIAETIVKTNPEYLQALGMSTDEFGSLAAKDKSAAVTGLIAGMGARQQAQKSALQMQMLQAQVDAMKQAQAAQQNFSRYMAGNPDYAGSTAGQLMGGDGGGEGGTDSGLTGNGSGYDDGGGEGGGASGVLAPDASQSEETTEPMDNSTEEDGESGAPDESVDAVDSSDSGDGGAGGGYGEGGDTSAGADMLPADGMPAGAKLDTGSSWWTPSSGGGGGGGGGSGMSLPGMGKQPAPRPMPSYQTVGRPLAVAPMAAAASGPAAPNYQALGMQGWTPAQVAPGMNPRAAIFNNAMKAGLTADQAAKWAQTYDMTHGAEPGTMEMIPGLPGYARYVVGRGGASTVLPVPGFQKPMDAVTKSKLQFYETRVKKELAETAKLEGVKAPAGAEKWIFTEDENLFRKNLAKVSDAGERAAIMRERKDMMGALGKGDGNSALMQLLTGGGGGKQSAPAKSMDDEFERWKKERTRE